MIKKVILVFKTHFDIGFTDLASNVIADYAGGMLDQVLDTCEATRDMGALKYVWTMPAWPLWQVVNGCSEDRRERLDALIRGGQVVWHALPFTSHTDFCGEEEYLEGLRYGKWLAERYGMEYPVAAKMTDVPGHGTMLPEILGGAGVEFLHLGCNAFATPPEVPGLFYWEAASGRRVLTMYGKGGYGSGIAAPEDWEFPVWMALMHTHDNCGPHSADYIRDLARQAKELYPEAEIVCGSMDDFYREMSRCDLRGVPVVKQDLADSWIHGIGAYPKESAGIRELRRRGACVQKRLWQSGVEKQEYEGLMNVYYENMHLFGEHTWGADVKTWMGEDRVYEKGAFVQACEEQEKYRFMEASWEEQRGRAAACERALREAEALLERGRAKESGLAGKTVEGIYNSSAQRYSGWVLADGKEMEALKMGGEKVPVTQIFGNAAYYVDHLEPLRTTPVEPLKEIPVEPLGETAVEMVKIEGEGRKEQQGTRAMAVPVCREGLEIKRKGGISYVENHRYRLEFEEGTGTILRLRDRKLGTVLMESCEAGIFSYQYTRHGIQKMTEFLRSYAYRYSTWGIQDYGRENYPECEDETWKPVLHAIAVDGDTLVLRYQAGRSQELYGDAKQIEVRITLPEAGEELFVELRLQEKQKSPYLESGSFCMPLSGTNRKYYLNKNGRVLDPSADICDKAEHVYYAIEDFVASDNGEHGVCVLPLDTPLLSIGEDGFYQYRSAYQENDPVLYFNLFNNMWGTNFPQWCGGDLTYRFVLWGYDKSERENLFRRSSGLLERKCLVTASVPDAGIVVPETMQLLNVKEDAEGICLVLRDIEGKEGGVCIEVPGYQMYEVDYYGRKQGAAQRDAYFLNKRAYSLHLIKAVRK